MKLYTLNNKFINETWHMPNNFTGIVVYSDGTKYYFLNNRFSNYSGPAVIYSNGANEYWINGIRSRLGGPAVICFDGYKEYWINGKQVSKLEHKLLYDMMKLKGLL